MWFRQDWNSCWIIPEALVGQNIDHHHLLPCDRDVLWSEDTVCHSLGLNGNALKIELLCSALRKWGPTVSDEKLDAIPLSQDKTLLGSPRMPSCVSSFFWTLIYVVQKIPSQRSISSQSVFNCGKTDCVHRRTCFFLSLVGHSCTYTHHQPCATDW